MTVWIAQCLCPARHCILATAGEAANLAAAGVRVTAPLLKVIDEMIRAGELNPHCGLCGAWRWTWTFETARTRFATMEEAAPALAEEQRKQAITAAAFGDLPRSD